MKTTTRNISHGVIFAKSNDTMKRFAILALVMMLPLALPAQENSNLGKKYGNYEIRYGKGKWTDEAPVTAIYNNATGAWVTSPKINKKTGDIFFLPNTDVEFIEGERYVPEAQGLVEIGNAFSWNKSIEYPQGKWLCKEHCGVYRIENDQLVPIVESGMELEYAEVWGARYIRILVIPEHALIIASYHPKDKEIYHKKSYSIFNLAGKRLYDNLLDFTLKDGPTVRIQLEDGSWHFLDQADGHMLD